MPVELVDPPGTVAPDPEAVIERNRDRARSALEQSLELLAGR